ncbi:MAG TPA: hypothetical protein PK280_14490 [Planctomycetota bacterium]|nr:hypothetical protein [Planctomycetota bacterium]
MKFIPAVAAVVSLALAGCTKQPDGAGQADAKAGAAGLRVVPEAAGYRISFRAPGFTDCAVWIAGPDGKTVRHLAAGLLGPGAPPPFAAGKLEQSLLWDGKDDAGQAAPGASVRVGFGLEPKYDRTIGSDRQWLGSIHALAAGAKGELYAYCSRGIVVLDREGRYRRQIVPAPAEMNPAKLAGLEPVTLADGTTYFARGYELPGEMIASMAISADGSELFLPGPGRYPRKLTVIGTDGSVRKGAFDHRLTALSDVGFLSMAVSPDRKSLYFAGAEAGYQGDDARRVCYRQAVYRLRLDAPGPAEIFTGDDENSGAPGFEVSRPRGLAVDSRGRVYVCNNEGGTVAVYTPHGGLLRTFAVKNPQQVAVHPRTGQIYVLAGREEGFTKYGYDYPAMMREARLVRIGADGQTDFELKLEDAFVRTRKEGTWAEFRACMAADFSGEKPVIWVGLARPDPLSAKWALLRIEDEGKAFGTPRECCPRPAEGVLAEGVRHLALDRGRDILYLNGENRLRRLTGDGRELPALKFTFEETVEKTDPKTGEKSSEKKTSRHQIAETAVGPDGNIYVLGFRQYQYADNYILRFDPDGRELPLPAGDVRADHVMKGPPGSPRGFSVGPDGSMYVLYYDVKRPKELLPEEPWDRGFLMTQAVAKYDRDGRLVNPRLVAHFRSGGQGVRADRAGNVYVADNLMPLGFAYPRDFDGRLSDPLRRPYPARLPDGGYDPLLRQMGSVFKFGPAGGRIAGLPEAELERVHSRPRRESDTWTPAPEVQWLAFGGQRVRVTGALWQHHGISAIPGQYQGVTHVERCVCRGARFDLDQFDRIYVPDVLRRRVTVLDSAGNVLCRLGSRGNLDTAPEKLGFIEPGWVAAASDRLYVADGSGCRIVRVKLGYAAEASCALPGR